MIKTLPAMQETWDQSLRQRRSPGEGNGNPLQYSFLENLMDRGAWRATVQGVTKKELDTTEQLTISLYSLPKKKLSSSSLSSSPLNLLLSFPSIVGNLVLVSFEVFCCFCQFFFFFQLSCIPYSRKQGQGRCPCLASLFCVLKPLEMVFCSVSLGRSCLSLCFLLHRLWLRSRST